MELDSRKKSRRDAMRRSKIFDRQEVREIGRKKAGDSRAFPRISRFFRPIFLTSCLSKLSHLMDGNYRKCLPDGRKERQRPGKIENM